MMIHNITLYVDYNEWLKRLDTHLDETTNKNSVKVQKFVKPTNEKSNKPSNKGKFLRKFEDQCNIV